MQNTQKPGSMLLDLISDILTEDHETVAIAESVTAGQLENAFSLAENAMQFFQGGITTYNLEQKVRHLKVDRELALACNCVSEEVAAQMAKNVAKLFNSDWGIAITGYASPVPEKNIHELFACYSFYFRGTEMARQTVYVENNSPRNVIMNYTNIILDRFALTLTNHCVDVHV